MKRHILHDLFRNILMVVIVLLVTISAAGAATNRGLAVPNETLPAELKGVAVQDSYTGSGASVVGEIQSVVGHVVVFREDKQYAYFAAPKDKLFERDVVYTLKDSRCRFQLYSSDIATMADNTRIMIKAYINNRSTGVKSTSFVMKKGKAMFYALRLFMYKGSSMEVETPTAVSGVRGTKWGVEVIEGKESASLPILVADSSDLGAFRQLAQANTGGGSTIIHSFEGNVFVDSVPPGQSIILPGGFSVIVGGAGIGNPYPTPPGTFQGFLGGGSGGSSGSEGGGTGDGFLGSQILPPETPLIPITTQTRPVKKEGYYVGMLQWNDSGVNRYQQTYYSQALQNLGSSGATAIGDSTPTDSVKVDGSGTISTMTNLTSNGIVATGLPQAIQLTEIGYNAYMAWGYWTQPTWFQVDGEPHAFPIKGYYVVGDVTAAMPTSISGTYSGIANGTVYDELGTGFVTDHSGTFNMNVNFAGGTGSVTNFNLTVGNPTTAGASITGGSGSITGNSFTVTGTSLVNNDPDLGTAKGSFYGPDGKWVGGVWFAGRANGNFIGSKP